MLLAFFFVHLFCLWVCLHKDYHLLGAINATLVIMYGAKYLFPGIA